MVCTSQSQSSGVRVHSHSEGAAIDFSVVDLNMEFVLASTDWCV